MGKKNPGLSGGAILGFYGGIKLCIRDGYDPEMVFALVLKECFMSIDARVETVIHNEDGSGELRLIDRPAKLGGTPGCKGQGSLEYSLAPNEVTALNGMDIWGGANSIMLGDTEIAKREGYTRIVFCDDETFKLAVKKYLASHS